MRTMRVNASETHIRDLEAENAALFARIRAQDALLAEAREHCTAIVAMPLSKTSDSEYDDSYNAEVAEDQQAIAHRLLAKLDALKP